MKTKKQKDLEIEIDHQKKEIELLIKQINIYHQLIRERKTKIKNFNIEILNLKEKEN